MIKDETRGGGQGSVCRVLEAMKLSYRSVYKAGVFVEQQRGYQCVWKGVNRGGHKVGKSVNLDHSRT